MYYKVSVVINAYNEEVDLPACVSSVKAQSVKPLEILVIDDASTDNTAALAKKSGAKVITLKKRVSRGSARDYGWRKAKGNIIIYVDADMIVSKDWIKEILRKFDEGADAVIDRIHVWKPDNPFTKSLDAFYTFRIDYNYVPFSAWAYKRSVLERVGGFKDLWVEEGELGKRILKSGYKILLADKAVRCHKGPPRSFFDMLNRNHSSGKNEAISIYKNHPEFLPRKRLASYLAFIASEALALALAFSSALFLLWIPLSFVLLYLALLAKFLFINKALGKVSAANCLLITFASLIRALIWPAGIIKGYYFS